MNSCRFFFAPRQLQVIQSQEIMHALHTKHVSWWKASLYMSRHGVTPKPFETTLLQAKVGVPEESVLTCEIDHLM